LHTCSKVDDEIGEEDCVADSVEDNPMSAEVVIEERDGDRQRDHVCQQQDQHHQVPIQSTATTTRPQAVY